MEVEEMRITEGFAATLAHTLKARIDNAAEEPMRLWRILDPEQRHAGSNPLFPLNGNWLNTVEQTTTAAIIEVSALLQMLELVREQAEKVRKEAEEKVRKEAEEKVRKEAEES